MPKFAINVTYFVNLKRNRNSLLRMLDLMNPIVKLSAFLREECFQT